MFKKRLIARIDVKNEHAIKGIHLEGLRKVGNPNQLAKNYYDSGIDEIIFMDAVAAYYDRNSLSEIISRATKDIFVPITVGGGIRSISDIQSALTAGADKVAINTQAVKSPSFLEEASKTFGSQSIVSSIDAKWVGEKDWVIYTDNGREPTEISVFDWIKTIEDLGAGEIMLTSIDKDGTKLGFDMELINRAAQVASIPLVVSGGAGNLEHCVKALSVEEVDAIAVASILHYNIESVGNIKEEADADGIKIR